MPVRAVFPPLAPIANPILRALHPPTHHVAIQRCRSFWRAFLASPECPAGLDPQQRKVCQQFLMRAVTASYPPELLANLTEAAIARAFEKQGAAWAPAPAAAAQAGGAGQLVGPQAARPLQPSRVPLYAFAASAVCLLVWLAVRPQKAARWRPP